MSAIQNIIIIISACFFVAMTTRTEKTSNLENTETFYPEEYSTDTRGNYFDYYDDMLYRDKFYNSLFGREAPEDHILSTREARDESLATQIALGNNYDAFNALTSNKREDEFIDNFHTEQDNVGEIPKKFNDPLDLDMIKAHHNSGFDGVQDANLKSRTKEDTDNIMYNDPAINSNGGRSASVTSLEKRSRFSTFKRSRETCTIGTIYINIQFTENVNTQDGSLLLTCNGRVTVNKCEGSCLSSVKPTLTSPDGYTKECSCCKDLSARSRTVTLSMCTLGDEEVHGYELTRTLLEPTACSCQPCRN
ncbi:hypothetical protein ACF0H5_018071 [Mactra antiquata]